MRNIDSFVCVKMPMFLRHIATYHSRKSAYFHSKMQKDRLCFGFFSNPLCNWQHSTRKLSIFLVPLVKKTDFMKQKVALEPILRIVCMSPVCLPAALTRHEESYLERCVYNTHTHIYMYIYIYIYIKLALISSEATSDSQHPVMWTFSFCVSHHHTSCEQYMNVTSPQIL